MKRVYVIFDGPPSHESGRFVEVETPEGASVGLDGFAWDTQPAQHGEGEVHRLGPFAVLDRDDEALLALARLLFIESDDFGFADFYRHNGEPQGTLILDGQLKVSEDMLAMLERNGWRERP